MVRRALVCCLLASCFSNAAAQTHVWLSPSRQSAGGGPGVPTLAYYNGPGAPAENVFYVWVRPQTDAANAVNVNLTQVSLTVRSDNADAIEFRGVEVDNPMFGTVPGGTAPIRRFEYAAASIDGDVSVEIRSNPDFIADFGGFSLFEDDAEGIGLGLESLSMGDSLYDAASVAFRLATVVIEPQTVSSASTDIYLQVGNPGMVNDGGQADGHMVVLGDPNDPALDAGASNETDSLTADALIRLTTLPADFDADLDVDGADLGIWERNYSTSSESHFQFGDATFDGITSGEDLLQWQRFHGETAAVVQSVPEPSTLAFVAVVIACFAIRRKVGCAERREAHHRFSGGLGGACVQTAGCAWLPPICVWENVRWHGRLAVPIGGQLSANGFVSTRAPQTPRNPIASFSPSPNQEVPRKTPGGRVARSVDRTLHTCCLSITALIWVCSANASHAQVLVGVGPAGGIYHVDPLNADDALLTPAPPMESLSRAPWGELYAVDSRMDIISIDPLTGIRAPIAPLSGLPAGEVPAIAFDRFGALWGIHRDATDSLFRVADITTGVAAIVGGSAASKVRGMTFATDGDLFGWDAGLGLVEIDTHAGGVTPIGNSSAQIESIAFDQYGNLYGSSDQLYGISTNFGIATPIGMLSQPLHGIEFYSPPMVFSVDVQGPTAGAFRDLGDPPAPLDGFTGSAISGADLLTTSTLGPPGPNPPTPYSDDGGPPLPTPGTVMFAGAGSGETPGLNLELMPVGPTGELDLEIDAISFGRDYGTGFAFSVDEFSRGVPGGFEGRTVASEALRNEAAADVFLYTGLVAPTGVGTNVGHRLLIDGNGSSAHGLGLHEADITPTPALPDPTDNLDAFDLDARASDLEGPVYFSLDAAFDDPNEDPGVNLGSAAFQTGNFSGADVLVRHPDGTIEVYATAAQLGLDPALDDVNALILYEDGDGVFDPARDWLMFSVRRGSAVIGTLDDRLGLPIFSSDLLGPPVREGKPPVTVTTHDTIVLDQDDDIDGLDNVTSHPNRLAGDMTYDDFIDLDDEFAFALGLANIDAYRGDYIFPPGARGNFDADPEFDFDDVPGFLAVLEMVMNNPPATRVPEPVSCVLLGLGMLMLQRNHRRRQFAKTPQTDSGGGWGARVETKLFAPWCPPIGTGNQSRQRAFSQTQMGGNQAQASFPTHAPPKPPGIQLRLFSKISATKSPEQTPRDGVIFAIGS